MEFGTGDKVHVTRLDGEKVDFYATIGDLYQHGELMELVNCTDKSFKGVGVYLPNDKDFGPDEDDYYTLVTDEEDSELPAIQHDKLIKDIERLRGALIKTQNLADELMDIQVKYNRLTEHIRLKALHNPSVSRYKDLMCFINEMEGK